MREDKIPQLHDMPITGLSSSLGEDAMPAHPPPMAIFAVGVPLVALPVDSILSAVKLPPVVMLLSLRGDALEEVVILVPIELS